MRLINTADDDEDRRNPVKIRRGGCIVTSAGEDEEGCRTVCYSPARVVIYRLLAIARKCRGGGRREKVHVHVQNSEEFSPDVPRRKSGDRRRINVSGLQSQEMSFNLAAGLGLLSLIAASKTELDKTVELRKQMEVFLGSFKEEQQSKGPTPKPSNSEFAYAVSTTLDGFSNYSMEDHAPSLSQQGSENTYACAMHCNMHRKEESVEGINHLEAELAAEFNRLQLDVDAGGYAETGESSDLQEELIEMPSENTAIGSVSISSGEVIDPPPVDNTEFCGVPPLELERRLHEVLEARQEERIKELEAHLEHMKTKLQEKEIEVTWWKDTAKLISKQVPESSRALR